MKFVEPRPFADPAVAARKIVEIANGIEAVQNGRIYVEKINWAFLYQIKGTPRPDLSAPSQMAGCGCMRVGLT